MLGSVRAVVVEADDLDAVLLAYKAGVVLEAELGVLGHLERAVLAVQLPDDFPARPVDLVDAARVARGDEIVAVGVLVDAVDVEVVPCVGAIVPGSGLAGVDG